MTMTPQPLSKRLYSRLSWPVKCCDLGAQAKDIRPEVDGSMAPKSPPMTLGGKFVLTSHTHIHVRAVHMMDTYAMYACMFNIYTL